MLCGEFLLRTLLFGVWGFLCRSLILVARWLTNQCKNMVCRMMSCVPCLRSSKCHGDMANLPLLLPNRSLNAKREFWLLRQHITVDRHGLCALTSIQTDCVHSPRYRQSLCQWTHPGTDRQLVSVHSLRYRQTACVSGLSSVQTACISGLTSVQTDTACVHSPRYRQTRLRLGTDTACVV